MAINSITFAGINSLDKGLYVSGSKIFKSAEKEYSKISVPGRNGDLLLFENRFKNVDIVYDGIVISDYNTNVIDIMAWLLSQTGYKRLEDTYNPDYYREALYAGPVEFDTLLLSAGSTSITFDCKPERWLKSGETVTNILQAGVIKKITNPTLFNAHPIIRVYGTGEVGIGTGSFTVNTAGTSYIDINCDIHDCYEGATNQNSKVTISKWPELTPGDNGIVMAPTITKIQITPRWWTI